jgi:hypothetical protein
MGMNVNFHPHYGGMIFFILLIYGLKNKLNLHVFDI